MPRFVARPVLVEAHQFNGPIIAMPESFRLAVRRYRPDGTLDVLTGDGVRSCKHTDWIIRGPDGEFSVVRAATFETWFEVLQASPEGRSVQATPEPETLPQAKRSHSRKEAVHG